MLSFYCIYNSYLTVIISVHTKIAIHLSSENRWQIELLNNDNLYKKHINIFLSFMEYILTHIFTVNAIISSYQLLGVYW